MIWTRFGVDLTAAVAIASALIATSTIWLLLNPGTLAEAINQGTAAPVARLLAAALFDVLRALLAYL